MFPDPAAFSTWQWDDESPTGPYLSDATWFARATLTWVQEQLHINTFPRGDYREFCELINVVLGGEVCKTLFWDCFTTHNLYIYTRLNSFFLVPAYTHQEGRSVPTL